MSATPILLNTGLFMIQTILIDTTLASKVIQSAEAMDGFIFAYMVKATFVSGRINNASVQRICKVLGIGNRVCRRGLKSALEQGFVRREGRDIIANKLDRHLHYVYSLQVKIERNKRCPFKFTELRRIIRKAVIENHVSKQNDFCNTAACSVSPRSRKEYLRARRRIKRMCKKPIAKNADRLSNRRIMDVANLKRSTAKSIMREMVKAKVLTKTVNIEPTGIDIQRHLGIRYTDHNFRKEIQGWAYQTAQNLDGGFPVFQWEYVDERNFRLMAYIQYANSYKINHGKIRLFL